MRSATLRTDRTLLSGRSLNGVIVKTRTTKALPTMPVAMTTGSITEVKYLLKVSKFSTFDFPDFAFLPLTITKPGDLLEEAEANEAEASVPEAEPASVGTRMLVIDDINEGVASPESVYVRLRMCAMMSVTLRLDSGWLDDKSMAVGTDR